MQIRETSSVSNIRCFQRDGLNVRRRFACVCNFIGIKRHFTQIKTNCDVQMSVWWKHTQQFSSFSCCFNCSHTTVVHTELFVLPERYLNRMRGWIRFFSEYSCLARCLSGAGICDLSCSKFQVSKILFTYCPRQSNANARMVEPYR